MSLWRMGKKHIVLLQLWCSCELLVSAYMHAMDNLLPVTSVSYR